MTEKENEGISRRKGVWLLSRENTGNGKTKKKEKKGKIGDVC